MVAAPFVDHEINLVGVAQHFYKWGEQKKNYQNTHSHLVCLQGSQYLKREKKKNSEKAFTSSPSLHSLLIPLQQCSRSDYQYLSHL